MDPVVSVIIPTYNAGRFLARTLDSICRQTWHAWEAIVVDDGSSDNSADIARSFISEDNRIKLIQQSNGGVAKARNTGLHSAIGKFVVFLDADDLLLPDALEFGIDFLRHNGSYGCMGTMALVDEAGRRLQSSFKVISARLFLFRLKPPFNAYPVETIMLRNFCMVGAGMWHRNALLEIDGFDESLYNFGEDFDLWLRLSYTFGAFRLHPKVVSEYRIVGTSNSRIYRKEFYRYHLKIMRSAFKRIRSDKYDPKLFLAIAVAFMRINFTQKKYIKNKCFRLIKHIIPEFYASGAPELLKLEASHNLIFMDSAISIPVSLFRTKSHYLFRGLFRIRKKFL